MQRWPIRSLPANKNPVGTRCIQITIPDDDDWERAIYAEVTELTRWMRWERDVGKNGKPVADRWLKAIETWRYCDGAPSPIHGIEIEDVMPLRVDCDCNVWITCVDGTEKQILTADQVQNAINQPGGSDSPGGGAPQPTPGGGCVTQHLTLLGSKTVLLPVPVSTGDTLEASAFAGSTNFSGDPFWFGPNGLLYFAGEYQSGTGAPFAGNPVPAELTQGLVVFVGGNYYSLIDGVFTIPGGVSNEQPVISLNTDTPGNLSGTVNFDVKVCNNQDSTWEHTFNFKLTTAGFSLKTEAGWAPPSWGGWSGGIGWVAGDASTAGPLYTRAIDIHLTTPSTIVVTRGRMKYDLVKGTFLPGLSNFFNLNLSGVDVAQDARNADTDPDGTDNTFDIALGSYSINDIWARVFASYNAAAADGSADITSISLEGTGPNPFA